MERDAGTKKEDGKRSLLVRSQLEDGKVESEQVIEDSEARLRTRSLKLIM